MQRSLLLVLGLGLFACGGEEASESTTSESEEESEEVAEAEASEDEEEEDLDELADDEGDEHEELGELRVDADELTLDDSTRARVAAEERHLFHILIRYRGADRANEITRSKEAAEARANEALAQARAGDFSAVAAEMSDDTANADHGGDMGMLAQGLLPEALDDALFSMEIGEIRGPIESPLGYHVLLRGEREE